MSTENLDTTQASAGAASISTRVMMKVLMMGCRATGRLGYYC